MPFINNVIDKNREHNDNEKIKSAVGLSRFKFDPDKVMQALRKNIVGQDAMYSSIENMLQLVKADFGEPHRPLAVLFFLGPTGVGKTETVRVLTKSILGSADHLCRIDMNTLAQEHYVAALAGAPPGYVGSKENHTLFDIEKTQGSYSQPAIVLFDEIEKASPDVIRALLNVLDSGYLELSAGNKTIDFRNAILFMTSNIGSQMLLEDYFSRKKYRFKQTLIDCLPNQKKRADKKIDEILRKKFDPEFINRLDSIVLFNPLDENCLDDMFDVVLTQLNDRLAKKGLSVSCEQQAKAYLLSQYNKQYGARDLKRQLRTWVEPQLARLINQRSTAHHFKIILSGEQLTILTT